jgi:hypothetical protein
MLSSCPDVLDVIRSLQAAQQTVPCRPKRGDRIGFALSSKDRFAFTLQTIKALDAEGGFDLIWNDGSDRNDVRDLSRNFVFQNARLVEVNFGVRGGPDKAICFSLKRLLDLGYDYIGLIENDVVLRPGWLKTLTSLFHFAAEDGLAVGAASVMSYESRVLAYRKNYSIDWARGANMVLFSRPAAQLLLDHYQSLRMTSWEIRRFYADLFGIALQVSEWSVGPVWLDGPMSLDWGYTPLLYQHGYASVGSVPSMAYDLEFDVRQLLQTNYVGPEKSNAGIAHPRIARSAPPERA